MKYLKKYKVFESSEIEDIKSECEDILLELKDGGIPVSIKVENSKIEISKKNVSILNINIGRDMGSYDSYLSSNNYRDLNKYIEDFEHLFNYLKSEKYIFDINSPFFGIGNQLSLIIYMKRNRGFGKRMEEVRDDAHEFPSDMRNENYLYNLIKNTKISYIRLVFMKEI